MWDRISKDSLRKFLYVYVIVANIFGKLPGNWLETEHLWSLELQKCGQYMKKWSYKHFCSEKLQKFV